MMATILAIDWGSRRIGVARAHAQLRLAEPLTTLSNDGSEMDRLRQIVKEEDVETVVVGLPRNLEGEETKQSASIRQFAETLAQDIQCNVVMQDETLSTKTGSSLSSRYPDAGPDSLAATVILQDYLDTN